MEQIRVNLKSTVNASKIRREKRNGRDVIVVPSATLPDDVIMNRVLYPANVIEAGYKTLERTPAPLGHPKVDGVYVNASDPEAINGFWVGAWNQNVRRENGRVWLDKVIDVQRAESTEEGRTLLEAINKQQPIHTSAGLFLSVDEVEHDDYDRVATAMVGDHDCFMLDQDGAATPEQGVGVFVNSAGEKLEVVNSEVPYDPLVDAVNYMIDEVERSEKRKERKSLVDKIVNMVHSLVQSKPDEPVINQQEGEPMAVTEEQFNEAVAALTAKVDESDKAVTALNAKLEAIEAEAKAKDEADHTAAVEAVVNAKLMEEAEAKDLPTAALNAMVKATRKAATLAPGMATNHQDAMSAYQLPEGE